MTEQRTTARSWRAVVAFLSSRSLAALGSAVVVVALAAAGCATPVITPSLSSVAIEDPDVVEALPTFAPAPTAIPIPVEPDDDAEVADQPPPEPTAVPNPGVTDDVIRIVTINDVSTGGIADDIYLSAQQGIEAWANSVNSSGGLAGRRVELVSVDSAVVNHATQIERVCNSPVLALVGSLGLQDGDGLERLESPDCRIPDFPALANSPARRNSDITFVSNPLLNSFYNVSTIRYVAEEIRNSAPGAVLRASDVLIDQETFKVWNQRTKEAAKIVGFLPGTSYAPSVGDAVENSAQALLDAEVQTLFWTADSERLADLLVAMGEIIEENREQDPDADDGEQLVGPEYVICDIGCYDPKFVETVGEYGNAVYTSVPHHLVAEAPSEPEMQAYLFWLNETHPDAEPTSYGIHAWAAGYLFEEAVNQLVGRYTADEDFSRVNREGLIDAARNIDEWNVRTLFGSITRPGSKFPGECSIVLRLQDGEWERVKPASVGYDCDPENLVRLQATDDFGLQEGPELSATNSEAVAAEADAGPTGPEEPVDPEPQPGPEPEVVDSLEETEELPD